MTLDIFGDIKRKKPTTLHEKFLMLRDLEQLHEQRRIVEDWTDGFIDRDGKIVDDFQKQFHPSFWEFYLYAVFKELGLNIDMTKDTPDFVVTEPYRINIEAVVPEIREKGRDESKRTLEESLGGFYPFTKESLFQSMLDEAIERHSSAFCKKANKYYETYKKREWVNDDIPYVIALASFDQVNYGREFYYPMMALLYGWYYNQETDGFINKKYSTKLSTGRPIDTALFEKDEYKHVSAVIYTCTLTLGKLTSLVHSKAGSFKGFNRVINIRHDTDFPNYKVQFVTPETPELLTDGLFIFYNPNANVRIPQGLFAGSNIVEIEVDKMMKIHSENLPLVARVNSANVFLPQNNLDILEMINRNYNFEAARKIPEKK